MNNTELPIASPCEVDWTAMTLADRGRFCSQCKKVVRELAQLTEGEARALLASPPTEGLCVRYVSDATGEIIFRPDVIPAARLMRRAAMAIATAALPLAVAGCMGMAPPPPQPPPQMLMGAVVMGAPPPLQVEPSTSATPATSAAPVATDPPVQK